MMTATLKRGGTFKTTTVQDIIKEIDNIESLVIDYNSYIELRTNIDYMGIKVIISNWEVN